MRNRSHFSGRFGKPTFKCCICERLTRDTGQGVDHLCEPCFEICSMDNGINDAGGVDEHGYRPECERLLKIIADKGGNVAAVKRQNSFVWPEK